MKIDYKKAFGFGNQSDSFPFSYLFRNPVVRAEPIGNTVAENYQDELSLPLDDTHHLKIAYVKYDIKIENHIKFAKRLFDVIFSVFIMIIGFPVFVLLYLITKYSSKGPVIYKQERLGRNQQPFYIYKFRSMRTDAEASGPQLSSEHDPRITRWGRVIRRTRLDELPQFWNVLKGDMSVVGPRPEREHFVKKIIERNADYKKLHALKPGITSLGQVHFGYAENIDQMCIRMLHDLDYLENISLNADLKVILKTIKVMVQCKGK